jgi:hypothetical protein
MHTEKELRGRWTTIINRRLRQERILTDKRRFGRKALRAETVQRTWDSVVGQQDGGTDLPPDWVTSQVVLVGVRCRRLPGRNR